MMQTGELARWLLPAAMVLFAGSAGVDSDEDYQPGNEDVTDSDETIPDLPTVGEDTVAGTVEEDTATSGAVADAATVGTINPARGGGRRLMSVVTRGESSRAAAEATAGGGTTVTGGEAAVGAGETAAGGGTTVTGGEAAVGAREAAAASGEAGTRDDGRPKRPHIIAVNFSFFF